MRLFLLLLNLSVDEEDECCAQGDDAADGCDFVPVAHDDGTEDLASQLELQTHGQAFGQRELGGGERLR